ncbi:polysaccharide deacetylase family protein [Granulicella sp. dw_53]|uniref:polysaccharide deacetylase family protein n=1 Tax=Granulicella sp. dw_53 TaxID=2719792 RepID=UPI001BD34231|nr:polysaccharide deacetylase family protein [Granulicella sp. dw_53]
MQRLHFLYHELRTEDSSYSYVVKSSEFSRQMKLFGEMQRATQSEVVPEVTFDDGHISNLHLALPILQEQAVRARFFITVGWTGRRDGYMGWTDLRELQAAQQEIGAHGWTHTLLTHCNATQLQTELKDARLKLEDELGAPVPTMSLPGGRYNKRVLEACREAGYKQIFTSIPQLQRSSDEELVGRLNVVGGMSLEWMERVLDPASGLLNGLARKDKVKGVAKSVLGDVLYARLWALVNRSEPQSDEPA